MQFIQSVVFFITSFIYSILPVTTFVEGVVGQPRSFLPSQVETQSDKTISSLIYRGLFKYDIYGTLLPDLAESYEISEDGLVYTIKLKENQFWSDGARVTSDDLIYTAFKVSDLQGVATDRVDDLTVRYTLPNKFSPFLSLLTIGIMQNNSEESGNPLIPISNGKFSVVRVERSGPVIKQVVLLNNDNGDDIKKLVFRYYANEDELVSAARLGEIEGFVAEQQHEVQNFDELRYPLQGVYYSLYFNLRKESFQDLEFRQKLAKTLPVETLTANRGIFVQGPISRGIFTDEEIDFDAYDQTFVKETIEKELTITVPDIAEHVALAKEVESYWENSLGIAVRIREVEPEKFTDDVIKPRDFDVLLYGQEIGRDPDRYVNWHSTQKEDPGLNLSGFDHVRSDRALEEGRKEVDNDKRLTHYSEFQKTIIEQVPAVFLYHPYMRYYLAKGIEGVGNKYTFTIADRFLDFSNWTRVQGI
jgi:peptide/nickel transport system substrate-binding protein